MIALRYVLFAFVLGAVCAVSTPAVAGDYGQNRQYYSGWRKHPSQGYYYRYYYYKPTPKYSGFKHHYVVYSPSSPKHYYYYNPYTKKYWGRCPTEHRGEPLYSHLKPADQKPALKDIKESSFPAPGALPPVPESDDGALLSLPPDDLPTQASLPG